jgi:oligo-1,6-glucosidase
MTNAPFATIADFRDIESLNHHAVATAAVADDGAAHGAAEQVLVALRTRGRDNARTPMQWDAGPGAGFSTGTPWIGVNPNHIEVNAEAALADPESVFHHYRRLIELRHSEPAVALGDFTLLLPEDERIYAFTRELDGVRLLVVANLSGDAAVAVVPDAAGWAASDLLIGNYPGDAAGPDPVTTGPAVHDPAEDGPTGIALRPWEARVYRRAEGSQP